MEGNLNALKDILKNLKKSPGRTYSDKTIQIKLDTIDNVRKEFLIKEAEETDENKVIALKLEFNNIFKEIKEYLSQSPKLETKMAAFSLDTASKALPLLLEII